MIIWSIGVTNFKLNSIGNVVLKIIVVIFAFQLDIIFSQNPQVIVGLNGFIYMDGWRLLNFNLIVIISFIAALSSHNYIQYQLDTKQITIYRVKLYYALLGSFELSMTGITLTDNIILVWIFLEATTLATVFLIGFEKHKKQLEAAWKYVILCSLGIGLGLVGIELLLYSYKMQASNDLLQWRNLFAVALNMDPTIAKIAFVFLFVGIGTKAGIAPMHSWLPDAYEQAPYPISVMLSGCLSNLSMYIITRIYQIVRDVPGLSDLKNIFFIFGAISMIIGAAGILQQTNFKRMIAFSSVISMGLLSVAIGFENAQAMNAFILLMFCNSLAKALLFIAAGNIEQAYKTKNVNVVNYSIKYMPYSSVIFILGFLFLTGMPPFASFFGEFQLFMVGISQGHIALIVIIAFGLLFEFMGFLKGVLKMVFQPEMTHINEKGKDNEKTIEDASDSVATKNIIFAEDKKNIFPTLFILIFIVIFSLIPLGLFNTIISEAVSALLT
jgi:hydrogenase-4 component F